MRLKWKLESSVWRYRLILTQDRCTVCAKRTIGSENRFGRTRRNSYVMWVMSNIVSIHLETVLVSLQDRCMVCAKHTKAPKLFWTHQMVLLGDEAHVEARFGPFGVSANFDS